MATRIEKRLGAAKAVDASYTSVGVVGTGKTFNLLAHVACLAACNLRLYVVASSWTSGEPTGADLVATLVKDGALTAGEAFQVSGVIMEGDEELVAYSSVTDGFDIIAQGVEITP